MKEKFIFFDLDGTLLGTDFNVRTKTIEAINYVRKNKGFNVTIATGRSLGMSKEVIKEINADKYAILANGNFVYDIKNDKLIPTNQPLSKETKKYILDYLVKHQNSLVLYTDVGDFFYTLNDQGLAEFEHYSHKLDNKSNMSYDQFLEFLTNINAYSISMFMYKSTIEGCKKDFAEFESKNMCKVTSAHPKFVDISAGNVSKFDGFKKLCQIVDIDLDNTYYFGDSENDYEMICNIKNSVAMGNACEKDKQKAKHVLQGSNDTDSIYDFLKKEFEF